MKAKHTWPLFGMLTLIGNLFVLAMTIKLYTEYFKDRAISSRSK